jgi:predicted dehydrogenase
MAGAISQRAYAAEDNTIKIALVGCGGRGNGAVHEALQTAGPTKLFAAADFFEERVQGCISGLTRGPLAGQVDVPPDRRFVGLDGYRKAIDAIGPGGVVLLATPPAFRPIHLEYAVAKGCHVFMEKSFAVDAPGIRRVLKAGEEAAKKNLKIAGGLRCRHDEPLQEAIGLLPELIGDPITLWAYREHGPVGLRPREGGISELAHQVRNYSCYTWLNGSFFLDWLIHNLDICCWIKGSWPVSAQGQGGRQTRTEADQLFDHYAVEYSFADGTRLMAQGRLMSGCWDFFGVVAHGTKGSAVLGEGQQSPRIFKGFQPTPANQIWKPAKKAYKNPYQIEHDLLFAAIRQDKPYNETEFSAKAAMAGILGRMAAESGREITWDQAMASTLELAPGLDSFTMSSPPPVTPDAQGRYPIAMPGFTKVL